MTINADRTQTYQIVELCLRAARLAGVRNKHQALDVATSRQAMEALENRVRHLQNKGVRTRERVFLNVPLAAGTDRYTLDANVLDVFGTAMFIPSTETDIEHASCETPIQMVSRDEWQTKSSKSATGRPVEYYPHREADLVEVRLWPIPDDSGTVRFQIHQKAANSTTGTNTVDFEVTWQLCLQHWIAHDLALEDSKDMERVVYLASLALKYESECIAFARPRGTQQAIIDHDTGYY